MKQFIALFLLIGLTAPLMAAEKKSSEKKPASEKKEEVKKASSEGEKAGSKSEAEAKTLTPTQKTKLLNVINTGDEKALTAIPGIGETRAAAVKKARPIADVMDLLKVEGIGEATFSDIIAYAKSGMTEEKKAEGETKSKAKPKAKAKSTKKKAE